MSKKKTAPEFYIVEEGVPIPEVREGRRWYGDAPRKIYPFEEMRVGDSFLAPHFKRTQSIKWAASRFAVRVGVPMKFVIRLMDDGIRCWRIK